MQEEAEWRRQTVENQAMWLRFCKIAIAETDGRMLQVDKQEVVGSNEEGFG